MKTNIMPFIFIVLLAQINMSAQASTPPKVCKLSLSALQDPEYILANARDKVQAQAALQSVEKNTLVIITDLKSGESQTGRIDSVGITDGVLGYSLEFQKFIYTEDSYSVRPYVVVGEPAEILANAKDKTQAQAALQSLKKHTPVIITDLKSGETQTGRIDYVRIVDGILSYSLEFQKFTYTEDKYSVRPYVVLSKPSEILANARDKTQAWAALQSVKKHKSVIITDLKSGKTQTGRLDDVRIIDGVLGYSLEFQKFTYTEDKFSVKLAH